MKLQTKLLLIIYIGLLLPLGISLFMGMSFLKDIMYNIFEKELQGSMQISKYVLQQKETKIKQITYNLANYKPLISLLEQDITNNIIDTTITDSSYLENFKGDVLTTYRREVWQHLDYLFSLDKELDLLVVLDKNKMGFFQKVRLPILRKWIPSSNMDNLSGLYLIKLGSANQYHLFLGAITSIYNSDNELLGVVLGGSLITFHHSIVEQSKKNCSRSVEVSLLHQNQILSTTFRDVLGRRLLNNKEYYYDDKDEQVLYHNLQDWNGKDCAVLSVKLIDKRLIRFYYFAQVFIIIVWILLTFLSTIIIWKLINNHLQPVHLLLPIMKRVEQGNFSIKVRDQDQLDELGLEFLEALAKMEQLVGAEKQYVKRLSAINDIRKDMSAILNSERLYDFVVDRCMEIMESDQCTLWLRYGETLLNDNTSKNKDEIKLPAQLFCKVNKLNYKISEGGTYPNLTKKRIIDLEEGSIIGSIQEKGQVSSKRIDVLKLYLDFSQDKDEFKDMESILIVPLLTAEKMLGVLTVAKKSVGYFQDDDLRVFQLLVSQVAISLENASLYAEMTVQEHLRSEMEMARDLQVSLLPKKFPDIINLSIVADMVPAKEVGGDYFDYVNLPAAEETGIVIGDVSGKGVAAGLVMMMARVALHCIAPVTRSTQETLATLNRVIMENRPNTKFITMLYMNWNSTEKSLHYCGAGHEHLIIYHKETEKIEAIKAGGMAIGITKNLTPILKEANLSLATGDFVVLYTDGVTEAHNENGEMFSLERVLDIVKTNAIKNLSAKGLHNIIINEIYKFIGSAEQFDDVTLLTMKITKEGELEAADIEDIDYLDLAFDNIDKK